MREGTKVSANLRKFYSPRAEGSFQHLQPPSSTNLRFRALPCILPYRSTGRSHSYSSRLVFRIDTLLRMFTFISQRSRSLDESYDPVPPPIPPKFRDKSAHSDFTVSDGMVLDKSRSVPNGEPQLSEDNEPEVNRQRMASVGKICKIRVNGLKEGIGKSSRPSALDPQFQLSVTDDSDVVCFGAIVKKVFGFHGGRITFRESNIEVEVPKGAISEDQIQGFYFKVSSDSGLVEERSSDGSATHVCSPLLQFGPVGAKFDQPIRIKMPHCLNMSEL